MAGPVSCPLDGCDEQFGTRNGCVMHMLNKPTHTSVTTKAEGYAKLDEDSSPPEQDSSVEQSSGDDSSPPVDAASSVQQTSTGDPSLDGPGGSSTALQPAQKPQDEADEEPDCPGCGGELIDLREHDHYPGDPTKPTPFDFLCSECGEAWDES